MKKYFVLCLITMLYGCELGSVDVECNNCDIWGAYPMATIDDGVAQLTWMKPMQEQKYDPNRKDIVDPDKFDIYISENEKSNFRKLIEADRDNLYHEESEPYQHEYYRYTVDKLRNGNPYFFYVVSKKNGFETRTSETIMAVPNIRKGFEILMSDIRSSFYDVSVARQKNKLAYVNHYNTWVGGDNCCMSSALFVSNMDGSVKELVTSSSYKPSWSPSNDKIAFHFDGIFNVGWFPAQIAVYDCETQSITQLTDGTEYNYAPNYSENGELLIFQSTKNTPENDKDDMQLKPSNIWVINLKTLESFQVTDIYKASLRTARKPCWIDNDRFIFEGLSSKKYQIYESSVSKKQINKTFDSKWNDYNPVISPDKKKIAFISDRSGTDQAWIYHIDTKTYTQITPHSICENVWLTWDKIDWLNNSTIIFSISRHQLVKQRID